MKFTTFLPHALVLTLACVALSRPIPQDPDVMDLDVPTNDTDVPIRRLQGNSASYRLIDMLTDVFPPPMDAPPTANPAPKAGQKTLWNTGRKIAALRDLIVGDPTFKGPCTSTSDPCFTRVKAKQKQGTSAEFRADKMVDFTVDLSGWSGASTWPKMKSDTDGRNYGNNPKVADNEQSVPVPNGVQSTFVELHINPSEDRMNLNRALFDLPNRRLYISGDHYKTFIPYSQEFQTWFPHNANTIPSRQVTDFNNAVQKFLTQAEYFAEQFLTKFSSKLLASSQGPAAPSVPGASGSSGPARSGDENESLRIWRSDDSAFYGSFLKSIVSGLAGERQPAM